MRPFMTRRLLRLADINRRMRDDPAAFVAEESERYAASIAELAQFLATGFDGHRLVLLSGPSSSGKTTTAWTLRDRLREMGLDAHTVSMDDFYRGRGEAPRLEDGSFDYESLEALRLEKLEQCMRELLRDGCTMLPRFDFNLGQPEDDVVELCIGAQSVVIFEGIHAINPVFERHLPGESIYKLFVNTVSPIYDGEEKLLARRDIRLTRRLLRDERFRGSSIDNTLSMWQQVVRGENEYMFPYVDTVDYLVDTTHAYEPCVFAPLLAPALRAAAAENPYAAKMIRLADALSRFEPCAAAMPNDALLREFVG